MNLITKCFYATLLCTLIIIIILTYEMDREEEYKYYCGLPSNEKRGNKMLQVKARDGALSGLIMGTLTGGPVNGLIAAAGNGLVNPIVGGLSYLKNTDERLIRK
jgi:hypothetical protein